jgi:hypothetical protein
MKPRLALLPVALLLAASATSAIAADKVACNLIEDPAGDTFAVRSQDAPPAGGPVYGPQEDSLDVVGGDLASDGTTVTAVIRIAKLSRSIQLSPTGITAAVDFLVGSSTDVVSLKAVLVTGQPDVFEASWKPADNLPNQPVNYLGAATGVVDLAKNEVRIHAPASLFDQHGPVKLGGKLIPNETESATAGRAIPPGTKTADSPMTSRGLFADVAISGKAAVIGAKSCVPIGK